MCDQPDPQNARVPAWGEMLLALFRHPSKPSLRWCVEKLPLYLPAGVTPPDLQTALRFVQLNDALSGARSHISPLQGLIDEYQSAVEGRRAHVLNLCARIDALADELVPSLEEAITAEEDCLDALLEAAAARLVNPARPVSFLETDR